MNKIRLKLLKGLNVVAVGELELHPDQMPIAHNPELTPEQQVTASFNALLAGLLKAEQSINSDGPLRAHFETVE